MTTNEPLLEPEDFTAKLRLDKHALDEAIAEQADLYYLVAERHVLARDAAETAKAELDTRDSSEALRLRAEAERAGAKITEGRISEQVLTSAAHSVATGELSLARLQSEKWAALRDAFGQRASMIKVLAELYVAGYFSLSSVGAGGAKIATVDAEQGRAAMTLRRKKLEKT